MNLENNISVAVGEAAPDFELQTEKGEKWRLSEHLGNVVALLFYPKDETLVCTKQLCSVRDNWADYLATKALVVGVSPGNIDEHRAFAQRHRLPIPLLADVDRNVTLNYNFHWIFPTVFTRAIVIVDAKGIIRSRKIMLRAFRPADRAVIASIYAARADSLSEKYNSLKRENQ
ncbi:MAG: peroxiredoxin family protein [Actinomycetota bacterium]